LRECEKVAAQAVVAERESELDFAQRRLKRSEILAKAQITSTQELDDDRARVSHAEASVKAAHAQVAATQAGVEAAEAELANVKSAAVVAAATLARVEADRADTEIKSPRSGIVQHWQAQRGDLLAAGGKLLKLLDVNDLSVTFVLPEKTVKRVVLGSEVRVRVGVPSKPVVPGIVTSIASQPNLSWSTDELGRRSEPSMFRVKAKIPADVAQQQLRLTQAGVPAVVWLRLSPQTSWPKELDLATNRMGHCFAPNGS
jgi:HlyD family secretion protein